MKLTSALLLCNITKYAVKTGNITQVTLLANVVTQVMKSVTVCFY